MGTLTQYTVVNGWSSFAESSSNNSIRIKSAIIDGLYASNYGIFSKAITKLMTSLTVKTRVVTYLLMKMMGIENTDDLRNKMYTGASKILSIIVFMKATF